MLSHQRRKISIHVLRVEDDVSGTDLVLGDFGISIHVLRVEDDTSSPSMYIVVSISIHVLRVEDDPPPI